MTGSAALATAHWTIYLAPVQPQRIAAGEDPAQGEEVLGPDAAREEDFGLRLRTRFGAPVHPRASGVVDDLVAGGLARRIDGHLVLTPSGRLVASDLTARLLLAGAAGAAPAAHASFEGLVAETVIGRTLLRVLKHVIGLVQFLELGLGLGIARVGVGVKLLGELAIGGLEFLLVGRSADEKEHRNSHAWP